MRVLPVRGCHPLWPGVPAGSGSDACATGLVRVRSPLLAESRLMSFPPGTEMFQFPGFASAAYGFGGGYPIAGVGCPIRRSRDHSLLAAPPRLIAACHVLHRLLAPRHPPDALAFLDPRQRPPQTMPRPTRAHMPARDRRRPAAEPSGTNPATTTKGRSGAERPAYPCQMRALPKRRKDQETGRNARLAGARRAAHGRSLPHARRGHLVTTSRCPNSMTRRPSERPAWWAWADLNGRPHAYQACALTS
jgi:hypothetical protein